MKGRAIRLIAKNAPREAVIQIVHKMLGIDGGPGSGNFGHKGRPGLVGGSGPGGGSQYRTTTSKGKYVGITRSKAFKSISKQARTAKDLDSFIDTLSREQYKQFVDQYHNSGTKEDIRDYTQRFIDIVKKQKPQKRPEHKVVDGRNMLDEKLEPFYGEHDKYTDPTTGQVIDERIEDVMYKQGYLGMPKVVPQEEFDKITKEHPEMPLLYRSYTGKDAEQVQDFDDMLESGEWYVDCSEGGAGFGQGMYCAGVYPKEPLHRWDDPNLDEELNDDDGGRSTAVVFTDKDGNGFMAKETVDPDEAGELLINTPYLVVNEDGSRTMVKMDPDGLYWEDMNTGEYIDDERINKIVMRAYRIYECKDQDIGIYKDAYTEEREQGIKGALEEMKHYRNVSSQRVVDEAIPEAPEGKELVYDGDNYFYFDMKDMTVFQQSEPKEGMIIAIMNPQDMKWYEKHGATLWKVGKGVYDGKEQMLLRSLDEEGARFSLPLSQTEPYEAWAEVEGKLEKPKHKPVSSTRLMTLDPSAKIITYKDLQYEMHKADDIRRKARLENFDKIEEYCKDKPESVKTLIDAMYGNDISDERRAEALQFVREHPEQRNEVAKFVNTLKDRSNEADEEARKYDKLAHMDPGVAAVVLGYDAINAEGHGESGSYTIVLNRTKLIISEQRVDV